MKASRITAAGLVAAAGLWIFSGHLFPHDSESRAAITRFNTVMDQYETSIDNPDVAAELSALRHAVDVVRDAVEAR